MSEFQVVKHRKRGKKSHLKQLNNDDNNVKEVHTKIDAENIERKLNETLLTLKMSEFYGSVTDLMKSKQIEEIICYGLGNFADCYIARYQLALLTLLRENVLQIDKSDCHFFDPKLYNEEVEYLRSSGFSVISQNEEGKRQCKKKTLFYMPHCGKSLYNNVLWANWNLHDLSQIILIGNSFTNIVEMNPKRKLEESCWYVLNIEPYIKEEKLPDNFQHTDIFNDTVVITFPECQLQEVAPTTWQHGEEPQYCDDDREFISNKVL